MDILKSLIASDAVMIFCFALDAVLILAAVVLFIWYFVKTSKSSNAKQSKKDKNLGNGVEKINDDTYVIAGEPEEVEPEVVEQDNAVEHFVNQIASVDEDIDQELKDSAVIVNHPVEQATRKIVKKEEIQNFVKVDGVHKTQTSEEKRKSFNRGSNAYDNSTNFFNTIKAASATEAKKPAAKKTTTTKKED